MAITDNTNVPHMQSLYFSREMYLVGYKKGNYLTNAYIIGLSYLSFKSQSVINS